MNRLAQMAMIAPEGAKIAFGVLAIGIVMAALGFHSLGILVIGLACVVGAFFRDPERQPKRIEGVVISGADGKVVDVSECSMPDDRETIYHRVSVFMSPLDVHVNRAPVSGEAVFVRHTSGVFRAAYRDEASEHNERTLMVVRDDVGRRHGMMQVAGYLARRIVCRIHARDRVFIGQRVGLIMFGSRVDHFIPPDYRVTVALGERVRAGETVIGELRS
ncbi:MAG TPA: phosphatidylserine decarboxylase [Candidatus Binataceae bacterium]|nr:phosphatidylserine decarboxylase [Candidatus Binataceae bacterium]